MKRVLLLILVVLLLAGCGAQEPVPEVTEPPVTATEPVSIYLENSSVEQQTGGAVKVYVPEKDNYIGMAAMNGNIVLVSDLTRLTLVNGQTGELGTSIKVGDSISCDGTDFTASEHGVSYYRSGGQELVFLNTLLQQESTVEIPADLSGKPCVSHTNQEVYYCSGKEVRALHMQTGISRLVKEQACQSIELVDSHLDGTMLACKVIAEDGSEQMFYLDSATGQTLDNVSQLVSLQTGKDKYLATRIEGGMVEQMVFGTVGETPQTLTLEEEPIAAFDLNGAYTWRVEEGTLVVDFYDLQTGTHSGHIQMVGAGEPISIVSDASYIWILAKEGNKHLLYRWDVTLSPTGNEHSYIEPLYTRENPNTKGLEQCAQRAQELQDKYGIHISVGEAALEVNGNYELTDEFQPIVLTAMMDALEEGLAMFPDGFLQESLAKGQMHISLVRSIGGNKEMVQFYEGGDSYVVLVPSEKLLDNFIHGVCYVIDSHVLGNSRDYDTWTKLNPWSFDYDYNYYEYDSHWDSDLLSPGNRYFVDAYAMTFPHEDRCRTFVYAMLDGNGDYFATQAMQAKLKRICQGIRESYGLEKNGLTYRWEQYLNTSLAYKNS